MNLRIKLGAFIYNFLERQGLIITTKEEKEKLDKTLITIDDSIVFLERALDNMVSFEGNEKIDFILDVVDEYKKQLSNDNVL